ncbi:6116_t:CDS:2 [Diversispora eburnea]|uniref:6116_t:CDS:1 n=1 Tax=Diversispora eburnea TaxID=1213867 RepID=A0A9N9A8K3_9GLOM|nr:6116_t:CDS:2 [Diversispora eburnea]
MVPETYPNKVFPDQSEDSFWKNALEAKGGGHEYDAIWDPQRLKEKKEISFVIPPPPLPSINNCTRHSRNSSKVSWSRGLQTDSERHIELLESKLNEVVPNNGKQINLKTFVGELEYTPLSSLGYYPEENFENFENFENEEMELHNPLESDEGLCDTSSIIIDEILLRRKSENDYLWMNGMFGNNLMSYCMSSLIFVQNWICCGVLGLEDD